jgi:hypothetical protein
VTENRVLRRTFGPNRNEVAGGWRRLHNEEIHDFYTAKILLRWSSQRGRDGRCI